MKHVRLNIYTDFAKTIFASLLVGLIWSATAMLLVMVLARNAGATEVPMEKIERLGDAKEGRLVLKSKGEMFAAPTVKTDVDQGQIRQSLLKRFHRGFAIYISLHFIALAA